MAEAHSARQTPLERRTQPAEDECSPVVDMSNPPISILRTVSSDSDRGDRTSGDDDHMTEEVDELETSDAPSAVPAKRKAGTSPRRRSKRTADPKTGVPMASLSSSPDQRQKEKNNASRYRSRTLRARFSS